MTTTDPTPLTIEQRLAVLEQLAVAQLTGPGTPGPLAAPIVIGPFDNVPAPGSPIRSDWAQEISTVVTGHLARQAVLYTYPGTGGTSGGALPIVDVNLPAHPVSGVVMTWTHVRLDFTSGTGYSVGVYFDGTLAAQRQFGGSELTMTVFAHISAGYNQGANAPLHLQVSGTGVANVKTWTDGTVNRVDALWTPSVYAPT